MKHKRITSLLIFTMVVTLLTGCGGTADADVQSSGMETSQEGEASVAESDTEVESEAEPVDDTADLTAVLDAYMEQNVVSNIYSGVMDRFLCTFYKEQISSAEYQQLMDYVEKNGSYSYTAWDIVTSSEMKFTVHGHVGCDCVTWDIEWPGTDRVVKIALGEGENPSLYVTELFTNTGVFTNEIYILDSNGEYAKNAREAGTYQDGFIQGPMIRNDIGSGDVPLVYRSDVYVKDGFYLKINNYIRDILTSPLLDNVYGIGIWRDYTSTTSLDIPNWPSCQLYHETLCVTPRMVRYADSGTSLYFKNYADEENMCQYLIDFTTAAGDVVYSSFDAPKGINDHTGYSETLRMFWNEGKDYEVCVWSDGNVVKSLGSLSQMDKETLVGGANGAIYTEGDYYELETILPEGDGYVWELYPGQNISVQTATYEKLIFKVSKPETDQTGYVVYIDNLDTGFRTQYSYLESSAVYDDARALRVAQSFRPLD